MKIEELKKMNLPLDKKHVAFVGTFDHGSLELKDIVFEAY